MESNILSLMERAEHGDIDAQFYLSVVFEEGRGVKCNINAALMWCQRAAQCGDTLSQFRLAKMLENSDKQSSQFWLEQAASAGHVQSMYELGQNHLLGSNGAEKSYAKAKKWLLLAAKGEHAEANYYLGFIYTRGLGCKENPRKALQYFGTAAKLNSLKAQCSLAYMLEHGVGCKCDQQLSYQLYQRSASRGHIGAQFALACILLSRSDFEGAFLWFYKAAQSGLPEAQASLAKLYMDGMGTPRDITAALTWCFIVQRDPAAPHQAKEAVRQYLTNLERLAHQHQIDDAYTRAARWTSDVVQTWQNS